MNKLKHNCFLTVFILFSVSLISPLWGQGGFGILENYVQQGLQNSLALKQEGLEIQKALENINQARALFYPRVTFAPTYSLAAGGRRLQFPVGDLLNPVYSTLNKMTSSNAFPQIANVDELLAPNNFHDTKFSVQYSIYNPEIKYNYLIQKQLVSVQEAKRKVLENEIRHNIETAYYQYLQTLEVLKVYENARGTLTELVRLNQKLVSNQVATKDVVYAAEHEISKLNQQVAMMVKNRETVKAYFNYLIGNSDLTTSPQIPDGGFNSDELKVAFLKATSSQKTPPMSGVGGLTAQLDRAIEVSKTAITLQEQAAKRPNVFVGGNAGFQGFGYTFSGQAYGVAQFGLSWDLFKGYERKSKIQQAKIQTELLKTKKLEVEQQLELQVTQAYLDLDATRQNLKLAQDAQTKAEVYFKVLDSRFRNGNVLFIEWVKAQNEMMSAQLQQSLAKVEVLVKQSVLDKALAL
ncbi:MAG: TolC family protein [Cytophagia bacterium]|nr:MAG: TolC family protein [Runella sp.]TAG19265.1 MAG: TolC family protein [Cytophagales bacterium]TAG38519.1 MAG: TolC family protein [Cytophagia bacterium]TAG51384.1 MAG: TolC family protein [Runella slithyformis]TAG72971.1 MAG: TolC family protein [Runella slithyformis]